MAVAVVTPTNDNSRFELHSKVSSSVPKILVKSSHRGEIARWVQAIRLNVDYYSKSGRQASSSSGVAPPVAVPARQGSVSSDAPITTAVNSLPPTDHFLSSALASTASASVASGTSLAGAPRTDAASHMAAHHDTDNISIFEAADDRSILDGAEHAGPAGVPHEGVYDMAVINIKTQIELTEQLVASLIPSAGVAASADMSRTPSRQQAIKEALQASLQTLATLVSQQKVMTQDRERYLLGRIDREVEARRLWEENMLTVAKQQAETDRQLGEAARQNERHKRALKQAKEVLGGIASSGSLPTSPMSEDGPASASVPLFLPPGSAATAGTTDTFRSARSHRQSISIANVQEVAAALADVDVGSDDEDEDEFFDAIETGTLPGLRQYDSIANPDNARPGTPTTAEKQVELVPQKVVKGTIQEYLARKSLEPYLHVRNRLPIDDDKRPSVSCRSPFLFDARILLTSSVEHSQGLGRQGPDENLVPRQL